MKRCNFLFVLILLFSESWSQTKPTKIEPCDFFNHLSFKNGVDTLVIKGLYMSMGELDRSGPLEQLEKEKKLKVKDFRYAVNFLPENCPDTFYIPSRDKGKEACSLFPLQTTKTIYLTCIFFEKYKYESSRNGDKPFFIVDKIKFE